MVTVGVETFSKELNSYLARVKKGERITITAQGHEIAWLVPPESRMLKAREALKNLRKTAYVGDVVSPVANDWEMNK